MIATKPCCPTVMGLYLMGAIGGEETPVLNTVSQMNNFYWTSFSPPDGVTYSFHNIITGLWNAVAQRERANYKEGKAIELTHARVQATTLGTLGTSETTGLEMLDSSGTTIVQFADSIAFDALTKGYDWTGSVTLDPTEPYRFEITFPTWVTNPTNIRLTLTLFGQV